LGEVFELWAGAPASGLARRKFRELGVEQIAIGAESKAALSKLWTGVLGVPKIGAFGPSAKGA
jgi:hypothetical protein